MLLNPGYQYRVLIDPFLSRMHNRLASHVKDGESALDIACGNGTLALKMAQRCSAVSGIDISEESLKYARKRAYRSQLKHVTFSAMDATRELGTYGDKTFDLATISMALHQFSPEHSQRIMLEMKRIATRLLIIDYAFPLPDSLSGYVAKGIERIAGGDHYLNFKKYNSVEGLPGLLDRAGIDSYDLYESGSRIFSLCIVEQ